MQQSGHQKDDAALLDVLPKVEDVQVTMAVRPLHNSVFADDASPMVGVLKHSARGGWPPLW